MSFHFFQRRNSIERYSVFPRGQLNANLDKILVSGSDAVVTT